MIWKKLAASVLGAGLLGASLAGTPANAGDCSTVCTQANQLCVCNFATTAVPSNGVPVNITRTDNANRTTSILANRPFSSRLNYKATQLGSSYHTTYVNGYCVNGSGVKQAFSDSNLAPGIDKSFDCPASHPAIHSATLGISFTTDVCPQNELGCVTIE